MGIQWLRPNADIVNHRFVVAIYKYVDDENDIKHNTDIFTYDGINGVFKSKSGFPRVKFKDILFYIPLPEYPKLKSE